MPEVINMRRAGGKLVPCAMVDEEALLNMPEDKDLTVKITRPRSNKHHRFFWAFLNKVCENHDTYSKPDQLLLWLKVRLGYVEEVKFHNEEVFWVAKSTSFGSMDQNEFKKFFDEAVDLVVKEVLPGVTKSDLVREVEEMVGFKITEME